MNYEQQAEMKERIDIYGLEAGTLDLEVLEATEAEELAEQKRILQIVESNRAAEAKEKREKAEAKLRSEAREMFFTANGNATEEDFLEFFPVYRRELMSRLAMQKMSETDVVADSLAANLK